MQGLYTPIYDLVENELALPYKEGKSDCFTMTCKVVDLQSNTDYYDTYKNRYSTLQGGIRALRKEGFDTLTDFWADKLEKISTANMRFGDIVIAGNVGEEDCCVYMGKIVAKRPEGKKNLQHKPNYSSF